MSPVYLFTFSTSTRSEKEPNGNSEVEVKSAYVPSMIHDSLIFDIHIMMKMISRYYHCVITIIVLSPKYQ